MGKECLSQSNCLIFASWLSMLCLLHRGTKVTETSVLFTRTPNETTSVHLFRVNYKVARCGTNFPFKGPSKMNTAIDCSQHLQLNIVTHQQWPSCFEVPVQILVAFNWNGVFGMRCHKASAVDFECLSSLERKKLNFVNYTVTMK